MALFAIADLHLSLGCDKPMDVFPGWHGYVDRLKEQWLEQITDNDVVVIAGDVSWGMSLRQALADFQFLDALPGRKLLLKGNHDYWWETRRKMDAFFDEHQLHTLTIVHNDCYPLGDGRAVCGTRGWFYDAEADADKKILNREIGRLQMSVTAALERGLQPVVFLHYPPFYAGTMCREMFDALKALGVTVCYYGHIHGRAAIQKATNGIVDGISLKLISGDALQFKPFLIL
ncbi:MAG: serine/threonine protein phosphatase [Ruminococcaceae bacterium]|nr:serine/threonine protein phosphatase [Oscillospiraceae bacterium]